MLESLCKHAEDSIRTHSRFFIGDSSSEDGDSGDEEDNEPIVQFWTVMMLSSQRAMLRMCWTFLCA